MRLQEPGISEFHHVEQENFEKLPFLRVVLNCQI